MLGHKSHSLHLQCNNLFKSVNQQGIQTRRPSRSPRAAAFNDKDGYSKKPEGSVTGELRELLGLLKPSLADCEAEARIDALETFVDDDEELDDPEKAYLVGLRRKQEYQERKYGYGMEESLRELESLARTAGLQVVGRTQQYLEPPSPATYIGSGKVREVVQDADELEVETVVFDDELSPVQLKNLDESLGDSTRVCDRTALTLDIFSQRARTREGKLQVELAKVQYQLPRLTRMWNHLERQVGGSGSKGAVKGMGEKQIEIDKRLLRKRISSIKRELEEVRNQRKHVRDRRAENHVPVVALAGYTNAGKSTLLNRLTNSDVLVEDKLFATLDPTTRRFELPSGKTALLSDTVGFIQRLPTQLVAAFRATLEEMQDASLIVHVVDISHENAVAQADAVVKVLKDIGADEVPILTVWNKVDKCPDQEKVRELASTRQDVVCLSAASGEGVDDFLDAIEAAFKDAMIPMHICVPFEDGHVVDMVHKNGVVNSLDYTETGAVIRASVPLFMAATLSPYKIRSQYKYLDR